MIDTKKILTARKRIFQENFSTYVRPNIYPFEDLQASWLAYSGATVAGIKGIDIIKHLKNSNTKWASRFYIFVAAGGAGYGLGALAGTFITLSCDEQSIIFKNQASKFSDYYYKSIANLFFQNMATWRERIGSATSFPNVTEIRILSKFREREEYFEELQNSFSAVIHRSELANSSDFKNAFAHYLTAEAALENNIYLPVELNISDRIFETAVSDLGRRFSKRYEDIYYDNKFILRIIAIASLFVSLVVGYVALVAYRVSTGSFQDELDDDDR